MIQAALPSLEHVPELSQFFTPMPLARRVAQAVRQQFYGSACRILEPHCGSGNLVAALLEAGFDGTEIVANDIDPRWSKATADRCAASGGGVVVFTGPAANIPLHKDHFDCVVMNSPYEDGQDVEALELGLYFAPVVFAIVRSELEHFVEAHKRVFTQATVTWRARCIGRPVFETDENSGQSGRFETTVLRLDRGIVSHRGASRVLEENWFKT